MKAILIDTTKCIGCRACQVACKSWNDLPSHTPSKFSDSWSNPKYLDSENYTRIIFKEMATPEGEMRWHFIKRQCNHCLVPACESACPVGALKKLPEGPVVYNDDTCIGCRYCMMACPFQIPKFEWSKAVPLIRKCTFCADRLASKQDPACVTSCPTGTLIFGERDQLLKEAHRRIGVHPGKYHPAIYGEKIGGGTCKLYLTAASFETLGLNHEGFRTDLGDYPQGMRGREWMAKVPWVAVTVGGLCTGLYLLNKRRGEVQAHERKEG
ncbi:MAG: 4Fe-4S dicluster domain-containing protein [Desulfobaccales bacterium]